MSTVCVEALCNCGTTTTTHTFSCCYTFFNQERNLFQTWTERVEEKKADFQQLVRSLEDETPLSVKERRQIIFLSNFNRYVQTTLHVLSEIYLGLKRQDIDYSGRILFLESQFQESFEILEAAFYDLMGN